MKDENYFSYRRLATPEIDIGGIPMGGKNPIRIQSMTSTTTGDIESTVSQALKMIEAGCEYVRLTTRTIAEARCLKNISEKLAEKGYHTPLIADVHFSPKVAEEAARYASKIRINPGNYGDAFPIRKTEFTEDEYRRDIENTTKRLSSLVTICKNYGTAMRIGINHGSLSQRIISRYGDSPEGMLASAMEFIEIMDSLGFDKLILSMKSSNTGIMMRSTRMLVDMMKKNGHIFPIHLGVTEAGEGDDGRIKSALGICSLLYEGIGDTIRVSLTEDPEKEIPVAKRLIQYIKEASLHKLPASEAELAYKPLLFKKRKTGATLLFLKNSKPFVISDNAHSHKADIVVGKVGPEANILILKAAGSIKKPAEKKGSLQEKAYVINCDHKTPGHEEFHKQKSDVPLIFRSRSNASWYHYQRAFALLKKAKNDAPVILHRIYDETEPGEIMLRAAAELGPFFADGLANAIWVSASSGIEEAYLSTLSFNILQAAGARYTKTEYIACPSCGRTLFDIQTTLRKIKEKTAHLSGLKIAVMGCIVNGPGEMADADYGYIGSGKDRVCLYKNKKQVKKNIPAETAVDELVKLIKSHGDWTEAHD